MGHMAGGEGGEIFAIGSTIIIVIVTTTTTTTTASYFCCLARESRPRDLCGASILGVFRLLSFFFFLCCLPCIGSGLPVSFGVRLDRKLLPKIYEPDLMRHTQKYIDLRWPLAATATGWGSRTTATRIYNRRRRDETHSLESVS